MSIDFWAKFPNLRGGNYIITSDPTPSYNCIAWAAGRTDQWWWPNPDSYWPEKAPSEETLAAFIYVFEQLGYTSCGNQNCEEGFEKIAIYIDSNNTPTHAARQLPSGLWTSKLGNYIDISHKIDGVSGPEYGEITVFMKRPTR